MYKSLYDSFAHWFDRGQVYFYSDPHFSDEEMKYLRKDYIGDDEQVRRINSKIGKYDTIVILGDIGNTDWVRLIRGRKILVMGNHDSGASNYKREITTYTPEQYAELPAEIQKRCKSYPNKAYGTIYEYDNKLFDEVYEGPVFIADKILLSHEPVNFPYALNIHGHDHSEWSKSDELHWNMCAEHIDYTPVCLKTIIESGVLKKIDSIHRVTIDEATKKKKNRLKKE